MTPAELARFRAVEEVFCQAIECPPGAERDALVRERCGADEALRTEVTLLLERHQRIQAAAPALARPLPRFGAWQAVRLLGRGGMGTVYLAERADGAFRMSAAVKVVPLALASSEIEERFRRERQFLASLDHPKIARLIDGGVSENGLPYLVMEFADGLAIDRYCDANRLDTRARVALARQVLDALAYVHGRGVIHRDVKPSNILVDESGHVKLLDFGTARLADATAEPALTRTGVFALTPDYASPEQARGEPVTAASDIYSAGVLLYRLLTGRLPYRIAGRSPVSAANAIAHAEPAPSRLEAPLDAILVKAMSKDAAARYPSAAEMEADLVRYLQGRPVRARRPLNRAWAVAAALLALLGAAWWLGSALRAPVPAPALVPFDAGVPNPAQPALSFDGRWLAFASPGETGTHPDIWLKPMPRGTVKRVTAGEASSDEPALSPDGYWLAFHSTRQPAGIYLQPAAGGAARLLVAGGRVPRFSPDGAWIAYLNVGENSGDPMAANTSMLYRVPAQGGTPVRLARNASSVQGAAWSADSRGVFFLTVGELSELRLWYAPVNGEPAAQTPDFSYSVVLDGRACAVMGDQFFYTVFDGTALVLGDFLLNPALRAGRYSATAAPSPFWISGCAASANGTVLADEVDIRTSAWTLPVDAESGAVRSPLMPLTTPALVHPRVQFTPDGASFLSYSTSTGQPCYLQDYRTGARKSMPETYGLSSDGLFVLEVVRGEVGTTPGISKVLNLKTGESWGGIQTVGVQWDLSRGGQWVLSASREIHRAIVAWDTRTAEHRAVYAHPTANLYLASFSGDGRWALFISEEAGRQPRMWAAPFRGLQNVPPAEWVDLGAGDYPRWSPAAGRIYFTHQRDGYECIFTRAVDPATKRPLGAPAEVHRFEGRLTPRNLWPGAFRISVAQDKLAFVLAEQAHRLLQRR